jgi:hypothetical protein
LLFEGLKISACGNIPTDMDEITESPKISSTPGDEMISRSTIITAIHRAASMIYSSDSMELHIRIYGGAKELG